MIVELKKIEALENRSVRVTFKTEADDFSFIVPREHASWVCRILTDYAFGYGDYFLMLEKKIRKPTGEESLLFTRVYKSGRSDTLQISRYGYEQEK